MIYFLRARAYAEGRAGGSDYRRSAMHRAAHQDVPRWGHEQATGEALEGRYGLQMKKSKRSVR